MTRISVPDPLENFGLNDLLALVRDDGFGCLVWVGFASEGKFPKWTRDGSERAVRRSIYRLIHGPIRRGLQVGVNCGCALCVHPDHLVARSRSVVQRGNTMPVMHKANITRARRAASHLTPEQVAEIRRANVSNEAEARRYGISRKHHHRIRTGRQWVDTATPWAGLGAR